MSMEYPLSRMRRVRGVKGGAHVTEKNGKAPKLMGILTRRDLKFEESDSRHISEVMTKENLITISREHAVGSGEAHSL